MKRIILTLIIFLFAISPLNVCIADSFFDPAFVIATNYITWAGLFGVSDIDDEVSYSDVNKNGEKNMYIGLHEGK